MPSEGARGVPRGCAEVSGATSRRKGATWEREIAAALREDGWDARRNVTETQTGNTGDVWILDADGRKQIVIQAKNMARPDVWKAIAEAREAADKDPDRPVPFAVVKRTAKPGGPREEIAVVEWSRFRGLLALALGGRDG